MADLIKVTLKFGRRVYDKIKNLIEEISDDPQLQQALESDLGLPPGTLDVVKDKQQDEKEKNLDSLAPIDAYIAAADPKAEMVAVTFAAIETYVTFWKNVIEAAREEDSSLVADEFVYGLLQTTTVQLIKYEHPHVYAFMRLAGVVLQDVRLTLEEILAPEVPVNVFTGAYVDELRAHYKRGYLRFRLEQAADLAEEPAAGLPPAQRLRQRQLGLEVFWRSDAFLMIPTVALQKFAGKLKEVVNLEVEAYYGWELPPVPARLPCAPPPAPGAVPLAEHIASRGATVRISVPAGIAESASATLTLFLLADADGRIGLLLSLRGAVTFSGTTRSRTRPLKVAGTVEARVNDAGVGGLDAVVWFAGDDRFAFFGDMAAAMRVKVEPEQTSARAPGFMIPRQSGTRLEIGDFACSVDVSAEGMKVKAAARKSALVISPGEADAFVGKALGTSDTRVEFDIGVTIDSANGVSLDGGGRLSTTIAVNKSAGPVRVRSVGLALEPVTVDGRSELGLTGVADLGFSLGFLQVNVEQIGFTVGFGSSSDGAPEGSLELLSSLLYLDAPRFRHPSGIGIKVDSAAVTGGGFLFHDEEKAQYAGVFQLEICGRVAVKAIALITTRLPDGRAGFSMLIIASAEFSPPLGWPAFALAGVGVIVGINRTLDADALRAGLRDRVLDAILFPKDPLADPGRLVAAVGSVFPAADGRHVVGISAKLVFGRPPFVTLDLAIVFEGGAGSKLALLGQLEMQLPRKNPVLAIHLDAAGIWDRERGEFSLDATLYDSRIGTVTFHGDAAVRSRKGDDAYSLLSIGGYHPQFAVPAGFPKLERVRISFVDEKNAKLYMTGYLAITSNTKQVGAEVGLFVKAGPISFEAVLSFDALFDDDAGWFVDFDVEIRIKFKGRTLCGIDVSGRFSGPEPKHIAAELSLSFLFFSVSWDVSWTWGEDRPPSELPRVDPLPVLQAALREPRNWNTELPSGGRSLVGLRERPGDAVSVHPLGRIEVRQSALPLGVRLDRFEGAELPEPPRFDITAVSLGTRPVAEPRTVHELFAAADFLRLTDDEKLARPSFEAMPAGVALQPEGVTFGGEEPEAAGHLSVSAMDYEEIVLGAVDSGFGGQGRRVGTTSAGAATHAAAFGPAARSALRGTGLGRFQGPVTGPRLRRTEWVVARVDDLGMVPIDGAAAPQSFAAARQALDRHRAANPSAARALQVVPAFQAVTP